MRRTAGNGHYELAADGGWRRTIDGSVVEDAVTVGIRRPDGNVVETMQAAEVHVEAMLCTADVASVMGVTPETIRSYVSRGRAPRPVAYLGSFPVWSRPVIERWAARRRGR
jgi:hypothetical protein